MKTNNIVITFFILFISLFMIGCELQSENSSNSNSIVNENGTGDQGTGDQDTGDQDTGDQDTSDQDTSDQDTSDQIISRTLYAVDGNGNNLGICVMMTYSQISIFNEKGFLYDIYWDGTFLESFICYSELDGLGDVFYLHYNENAFYGKKIFYSSYSDDLYVLSDIDSNNLAIKTENIEIWSVDNYGIFSNRTAASSYPTYTYYNLKKTSREDVGIPDNIVLPISFIEKESD